ncbi:MAG TPA: NAD(P)H-dependent oxidoreductase [Candidatus Omnitrophota bacterium]|nr:NAD(P)H-dependent oxidoreductase [Candidatus Omnitrophota bacterium]HPS36893.1 NAD(P)H-dependent oxidoreductase [Candidatus Omnitrophota bacterium]
MKVLVILGHPRSGSFNHAIAGTVVKALQALGHGVMFHDLYQEKFDPVIRAGEIGANARLAPEIRQHCDDLAAAEGLVIIHPNWWGQPPAILKGWIDRVVRAGVAYRFAEGDSGEGAPVGLLKARTALILNTSDTPAEREGAVFGDPLETLWRRCVLEYCGVKEIYRKTYGVVVTSSPEERKRWLEDVETVVFKYFNSTEGKD